MARDHAARPEAEPAPQVSSGTVSPAAFITVIAVLVLIALVAFLVARSSSSKTNTTTLAPIVTTTTSTLPASEDPSTANALLWTAADFPDGWTSAPHVTSESGSGADPESCSFGQLAPPPLDVHGDDFSYGDSTATMDVGFHTDRATVTSDFAQVTTPEFRDCVRDVLLRILGPKADYPGVVIDVVILTPAETKATSMYGFRVAFRQFANILTVLDVYFIGQGRAEMTLTFVNRGGSFDQTLEEGVVRRATARLVAHPT